MIKISQSKKRVGLIFYTGTGTTAFLAETIGNIFSDDTFEYESHRLTYESVISWENYDIIGIGAPTWIWRAPNVLTTWLRRNPFQNKPYFIFNACAGSPGNTSWSIYKELRNHNNIFLGTVIGAGPNNIRRWRPKLTQPDPINQNSVFPESLKSFVTSFELLKKNLHDVAADQWHTLRMQSPRKKVIFSMLSVMMRYRWQLQGFVGKKVIDPDKCIRCGLCANKICPSGAITLNADNFPLIDEKKCQGCMGCINLCPTLAIETQSGKKRHPFISYKSYIK